MYGRVLARGDRRIVVRTADTEIEIDIARSGDAAEVGAQPGDWVRVDDAGAVCVVQAYRGGDFPGPDTETARLTGERRRHLETRARGMAVLRQFFAERAFLEVETPLMVPAPGLDIHIEAVSAGQGAFLITSPEFQMKRLLCSGLRRIYTVCKVFRANEEGRRHSSEFTMLEWYRAFDDIEQILVDTEQLVAQLARVLCGDTRLVIPTQDSEQADPCAHDRVCGKTIDVTPPWVRMTVADACKRHAGIELEGDETAQQLLFKVRAAGHDVGAATRWDDIFYTVFVDHVEPALAQMSVPVALVDWPARLAALARHKPGDPRWVERFEVYIGGVELCNAYGELTDSTEQRARFAVDLDARESRRLTRYPLDQRFLAALDEGLPPCAGIALGVDRLFMLLTGARHIRDVLTFTADEL